MAECRCCGKCCIIKANDKWVRCGNLNEDNTCRIYGKHLGTNTGHLQYCTERKNSPVDFPDCPYNSGKPFHPHYAKDRKIIDEVTVLQIQSRKWNDGVEDAGLVCPEILMTKKKKFLIKQLTWAINMVMGAEASPGMIERVSKVNKHIFRHFLNKRKK